MPQLSNKTLGDLITYCKRNSRLDTRDHSTQSYRHDRYMITKARKECEKHYPKSVVANNGYTSESINYDEPLTIGKYYGTRLIVTKDSIEYIAGQYAPTEVYFALLDYLEKTRG